MRPRAVTTCLLRTPLSLSSGPYQAHHPSLAHRSHIPPHRRYASRRTARTLRGQASAPLTPNNLTLAPPVTHAHRPHWNRKKDTEMLYGIPVRVLSAAS
eukprot:7108388-Prymnesium_polylepis.1